MSEEGLEGPHRLPWHQTKRHKFECEKFKEAMKEAPEKDAILLQWGQTKLKHIFEVNILLAQRELLGVEPRFGYWAKFPAPYGSRLLANTHISEEDGWKLPVEEIPTLTFQHRKPPTRRPLSSEMQDWTSYYKWRALPLSSPAALLRHFPLTIYRLLHLLAMTPDTHVAGPRRSLAIYYVRSEDEVDYLPIFGELALLLPDTDIEMVVMGSQISDIIKKATPSSLASRRYCYEYQAPAECGGGSIRIRLLEDPSDVPMELLQLLQESRFDYHMNVVIGTNIDFAGGENHLAAPIAISRNFGIPTAVTSFTRVNLANDADLIFDLFTSTGVARPGETAPSVSLNPFRCPGTKPPLQYSLPCTSNGFTAVVTRYA
ncbi:hypothetical protein BD410DRAFT_802427 [Rickenella mellea]|uniref:Mitochondrial splicing suppressor 51-like C-terminal domain-containing protein n=1 Tax=Rickenella mellea TaxID=50990 RepID=A0A4Y7Q854_9AGAM|nr:hypothetical protein BD410DRAFT_802427 [Rickenella mellea]